MKLDRLNRERREIEDGMQQSALEMIARVDAGDAYTLVMHRDEWHAGVVGLLASRLKEKLHRPVFAFATDGAASVKGSGRSIAGLHLRDALDLIDKRHPGMLERFGGHAAAAGASLRREALDTFRTAFEEVAREKLSVADLERRIDTDGALAGEEMSADFAQLLKAQVWGQGFPEPRFVGRFQVRSQRVVGERHLKLALGLEGRQFPGIRFGSTDPLPAAIEAVYRLDLNEYQGLAALQLVIDHVV